MVLELLAANGMLIAAVMLIAAQQLPLFTIIFTWYVFYKTDELSTDDAAGAYFRSNLIIFNFVIFFF